MKLFKVLASLGMASILAIPLCFGSSFSKPSTNILPSQLYSNGDVAGTGECVAIATGGNTAFEFVTCGTGGSGTSVILDLNDDGVNESTAITELATNGDTNGIFSEPSANKLFVNVTKAWPLADTATILATNPANCGSGNFAAGVTANGTAEGCTDVWTEAENTAAGYISSYVEADPVYGAAAASNVTNSGITNWNLAYTWGNHAAVGYLTTFSELDPAYTSSAASNVTNSGITNWNLAYTWGNHASVGYLTAYNESDPVYLASNAANVNADRLIWWDLAYLWGNHASVGYLTSYTENDYVFGNSAAINVTNSGIANWNSAYAWGNHATAGYLTSYTEGDYVYGNSAAVNVTNSGISNWNTAYAYGNHAAVGYLTSYTEGDYIYGNSAAVNVTNSGISNWNMAYTYGNHQAAGYLKNLVEDTTPQLGANLDLNSFYVGGLVIGTDVQAWDIDLDDISDRTTAQQYTFGNVIVDTEIYDATNWNNNNTVPTKDAIRDKIEALPGGHDAVTLNANADFLLSLLSQELTVNTTRTDLWDLAYAYGNHADAGYLTVYNETDPNYGTSVAANITSGHVTNWDLAYSWGNHASVGYLITFNELDPAFTGHVAYNITSDQITNWDLAYTWGNHAAVGYLTAFNELDPDFNASVAVNIDAYDVGNWDLAVAWGNHAAAGYLTSVAATTVTYTPAGNIASTNVEYALNELDMEKALGTHDHAGVYEPAGVTGFEVTITPAGNIAATNVGYALDELDTEKAPIVHLHTGTYEPAGVTAEEVSFSGAGNLASTNTQYALLELDTEKAPLSHEHAALYAPKQQFFSKTLISPTSLDDYLIFKAPYSITIQSLNCIVDPGDVGETVTITLQECNSTGGSCATMDAAVTCDNDGAADDGYFTDAIIASGGWAKMLIGTVTGNTTVGSLTYTVGYNAT